MHNSIIATALGAVALTLACQAEAQTGSGRARSESSSQSGAQSVARTGSSNAIIQIENPGNTTSSNSTRVSGTQRIISAPPVSAPSLAAAGIETCLGSISGGASFPGGGFSFGTTTKDEDCNRRLFGRQLYNMGYKRAAMVIHCFAPEVAQAMAIAGTPCPAADPQMVGTAYPVRAAAIPPSTPLSGPLVVTDPAGPGYSRGQRTSSPLPPSRSPQAAPLPGPENYAVFYDRTTGGN